MLEAIFEGASLFEAAVWFIGGLFLGGIGLAVFAESLVFRRRAIRKRARILGVIGRKSGTDTQKIFWPVYEHSAADGELIRARAASSGGLADNFPGAFRDVLVDPDDPYDVRSLTPVGMIIGIVCLVAGAGLFAISNSINDKMGVVSLVATAIVGAMAAKAIVSAHRREPITRGRLRRKWRERKKQKRRAPDVSKILTLEEHLAALRKLDATRRKWLPVAALLGFALLAFGGWRARDLVMLQAVGSRVDGTVVRIDSEYNSNAEGSSYTYYSVVRFETVSGREVTFRDSIGSSHPIDERGEIVSVIYDPGDSGRAIIDRGLWNWAIPGGCASLGALAFVSSVRGWIRARRRGARSPHGDEFSRA